MVRTNNTIVLQWPISTNPESPSTWGEMIPSPLYHDSLRAGSLFLDGRGSYLTIPYSSDLSPNELTIESWVYVVGDGTGALIGNGKSHSYWLALNRVLEFGYGGEWPISKGRIPLTKG